MLFGEMLIASGIVLDDNIKVDRTISIEKTVKLTFCLPFFFSGYLFIADTISVIY